MRGILRDPGTDICGSPGQDNAEYALMFRRRSVHAEQQGDDETPQRFSRSGQGRGKSSMETSLNHLSSSDARADASR